MLYFLIYVTCKNSSEAKRIGKIVVDEKLAACANIHPEIKSYYYWHGKAVWDKETVLILKTTDTKIEKIIKRVKELHSYTVPCILAFEIKKGNQDYLKWLDSRTKTK